MDSLLDYDSSSSTPSQTSLHAQQLASIDTNLRPTSPQLFALTPTMFGSARSVPGEPIDGVWLSDATVWEQVGESVDSPTPSVVPRMQQRDDSPQPSGQSEVDINRWLRTAASTNTLPCQSTPHPTASQSADAATTGRKRPPPRLPSSPSSSALSAFVDELLGSDFDNDFDGDVPMTAATVPTSASEISVPLTSRRPLVQVRPTRCDRCKGHSLTCRRSGKRINCDHCVQAHTPCTFNGIRASGAPAPLPRLSHKKKTKPQTKHKVSASKKTKVAHTQSQRNVTESTRQLRAGTSRRDEAASDHTDDSTENEESDDSDEVKFVSFSRQERISSQPDSSDVRGITSRIAAATSLLDQTTSSESAPAFGGRNQALDAYTKGLLHDIEHALRRVKDSLSDRSTLLALGPTLSLLLEGLDSMPQTHTQTSMADIRSYLRRFRNECIPKGSEGDQVQQMSSTLLTQSLVDRVLSLITALTGST